MPTRRQTPQFSRRVRGKRNYKNGQQAYEEVFDNISKMQIKTAVKYSYPPTQVAKIKLLDNSKCWQGCGAVEM